MSAVTKLFLSALGPVSTSSTSSVVFSYAHWTRAPLEPAAVVSAVTAGLQVVRYIALLVITVSVRPAEAQTIHGLEC